MPGVDSTAWQPFQAEAHRADAPHFTPRRTPGWQMRERKGTSEMHAGARRGRQPGPRRFCAGHAWDGLALGFAAAGVKGGVRLVTQRDTWKLNFGKLSPVSDPLGEGCAGSARRQLLPKWVGAGWLPGRPCVCCPPPYTHTTSGVVLCPPFCVARRTGSAVLGRGCGLRVLSRTGPSWRGSGQDSGLSECPREQRVMGTDWCSIARLVASVWEGQGPGHVSAFCANSAKRQATWRRARDEGAPASRVK